MSNSPRSYQQLKAIFPGAEPLLSPREVALLFRVDPKTVTRWAKAGKLHAIRTPGGHRRYRESQVRDMLTAQDTVAERKTAPAVVVWQ